MKKQCELLKLNRSSISYRPKPPSEADLALARRIDEIYTEEKATNEKAIAARVTKALSKYCERRGTRIRLGRKENKRVRHEKGQS